jgi:hypothetical protein
MRQHATSECDVDQSEPHLASPAWLQALLSRAAHADALRRSVCADRLHICTGTGRTPARYAPGPARGGWTGCADRSWSTTRANTTMPTMTSSTLRCECHSLAHSDTHTNAEARMRHVPSVCVRACVRACLCAHGPKPERVSILAQPWHAMRATADRACSGAARYPQPLYISGVNRFITVRRPASKANKRNDRRPAHKRATCRVSASEARLQRQCGAWRHRAWDAGIRLLDVHGERPLRCELVPS